MANTFDKLSRGAELPRQPEPGKSVVVLESQVDEKWREEEYLKSVKAWERARRQGALFSQFYSNRHHADIVKVPYTPAEIEAGVQQEHNLDCTFDYPETWVDRDKPVGLRNVSYLQYGKLHQWAGGPIQERYEHAPIVCSVSSKDHSSDDKYLWMAYKRFGEGGNKKLWDFEESARRSREEGGSRPLGTIIKHNFEINDKPYVAVTRRSYVSEDGEEPDRMYNSGEAIVMPASYWSLSFIPQLDTVLRMPYRTQTNFEMPRLRLSTAMLDESLTANWLTPEIENIVLRLFNGQPLSLETSSRDAGDYLKTIYHVSLCLPESISHQLTFASGAALMEGQVGLAFGDTAVTQSRKVEGVWIGNETSELATGYSRQVLSRLKTCHTGRECLQLLSKMPPPMVQLAKQAVLGQKS